ncbi:ParB N-terminal domain-containing protein [Streptomyces sp. NPDC018045]|uniref:ParB N-terminal domain-containing protein n=1 Tax=Streptomyces sp. NPDC018045 TaxID=3365037 RepID=UPI003796DB1F
MAIKALAQQWPTIAVADLGDLPDPDPELAESVCADGITEPLWITGALTGEPQIREGRRRAAAARAAGLTDVPYTPRPVIRVDALTAHPANARRSAKAPRDMVNSVAAEGVLIPVKVVRDGDGWRITDGHVRVDAARQAGRTHVAYEVDERDEASQRLDMVTTARHREGLSLAEEAAALFGAAELGADLGRIAAAGGLRTQKEAKKAIRAGGSKAAVRAAARYDLTLDQMAALADLSDLSADAAKAVEKALSDGQRNIDYLIQRETLVAKRTARLKEQRETLTRAGATIVTGDDLGAKARRVADIPGISAKRHEACQGHVWALDEAADRYEPWCKNITVYGHTKAFEAKAAADRAAKAAATGDAKGAAAASTGAETPQEKARRKAHLAAVKQGNLDWDAAAAVRRQFLAKICTGKVSRKRTDAMTRIVTMTMARPGLAADRLRAIGADEITAEILGVKTGTDLVKLVQQSSPQRLPVLQFAILAGGFEDKARREAWRTDGQRNNEIREGAALWLDWLTTLLGYEPEAIEAAVRDDQPYDAAAAAQDATGDQPATPLTGGPGEAEDTPAPDEADQPDDEPGDGHQDAPPAEPTSADEQAEDTGDEDEPEPGATS